MKHLVAGLWLALMLGSAAAADPLPASGSEEVRAVLEVLPGRHGYAFEQPQILVRQRLFGLAHGVSLLAAACLDLPEHSSLIQDAYANWHARQAKAIETVAQDLAKYYFGARATQAHWPDLVSALMLKDNIQPALAGIALTDACASLPAAIIRPRYDFATLLTTADAPQAGKEAVAGRQSEIPRVPGENLPSVSAQTYSDRAE